MQFISLEPFVPSGKDFESSKQLFIAIGFKVNWDAGDYVGFENGGCKFILQKYHNDEFASNLMISVKVNNADDFYNEMKEKNLEERFGVRIGKPIQQSYGKEVNLIDIAGVCWHFVE
jgi:hypothetical protein